MQVTRALPRVRSRPNDRWQAISSIVQARSRGTLVSLAYDRLSVTAPWDVLPYTHSADGGTRNIATFSCLAALVWRPRGRLMRVRGTVFRLRGPVHGCSVGSSRDETDAELPHIFRGVSAAFACAFAIIEPDR